MAKEGGFAEIASNSRLTLLYSFLGQHRNWQRADRASRSAARLLGLAEAAKEDELWLDTSAFIIANGPPNSSCLTFVLISYIFVVLQEKILQIQKMVKMPAMLRVRTEAKMQPRIRPQIIVMNPCQL